MGRPKKEISEEKIERFQKELEDAGDNPDALLQDKKGRSRSCLLCRRRKQKCDHKLPSCTACLKAAVKCVQPARYISKSSSNGDSVSSRKNSPSMSQTPPGSFVGVGIIDSRVDQSSSNGNSNSSHGINDGKDEYTVLLEKKLKYLEKLVELTPGSAAYNKKIAQYKKITHLLGNIGDLASATNNEANISTTVTNNSNNKNTVGVLPPPPSSLPSNIGTIGNPNSSQIAAPAPRLATIQPPTSTTTQIGTILYSNISNTIANNGSNTAASLIQARPLSSSIPALSSDSLDSIDFSKCIFAKYNLKEFLSYDPAFEFDEQLSRSFLDTFFTRLQFKYPLLDENEIYSFHEAYINNRIYRYPPNEFHFNCGRMWLVYSISACLHMTTGKYKGQPPVRYFSTAIRHITRCGSQLTSMEKVELLTLLVLYILRTDRDSMVLYEIIGDVMKICQLDLKLNRRNDHDDTVLANKKLRIFWCVYLLERMICVAVGKSYIIKESDIDLPLFDESSFNTSQHQKEPPLYQPHEKGTTTTHHKGVHFINQSLKLRRIESQFVEELGILPDKNFNVTTNTAALTTNHHDKFVLREQLPLVRDIFQSLEVWRAECSTDHIRNFENETLKLYYYRSVRLLIQPYLEILTPKDRLFRECQAAAGQICQLYKIFHQKTVTGHSTPAVHTVFVAGVTLIYCMWLARNYDDERRKKLGDASKHTRPLVNASLFSTMDDLRACSVCLYVMTERSNFARIFRDTFDQLMNATVGNLIERCGPDSAELIYMKAHFRGKNELTNSEMHSKDNGYNEGMNQNNDNNNNMIQNSTMRSGMPPAIKRTFGKRQAEEHLGFVENSQVDLKEQEIFKKKQGLLEKTSVPRGLSHLLSSNENETTYVSSNHDGNMPNKKRKIIYNVDNNEAEQYIVKKPTNGTEFDWQAQRQALLQQQVAQQNLQAYLSSLNYSIGQDVPIDSNTMFRTDNRSDVEINNPTISDGFFDAMQKGNMMNHSNTLKIKLPTNPNLTGAIVNNNTSYSGLSVLGTNNTTHNYNDNIHTTNDQKKSKIERETSILFSNGTHDMINNISTWTNDSVVNLLNSEAKNQMIDIYPSSAPNPNEHQNSNQIHSISMMNHDGNNGDNFMSNHNNTNRSSTNRQDVYSQNVKGGTFLSFTQTGSENVNVALSTSPANMTYQNNNSDSINSTGRLNYNGQNGGMNTTVSTGESNLISSGPVEDFWTVNDDYGFLT
ncbi:uncharacterized protein NDAI_0D02730 [Naumovozyma dairenensis CBS 421]|uniref:Zn(2)-C6 fungal-type domain-containing protein n=1 Tax=Naumovozyma dairenensis (strain ATCC 10597 / BCRC 20456 / CBS 421 / NBRC 0211 / NRRL Y-12639) TaxID=1071378 RepID=G0W9X6_NAUDC|nr:hypothetical protein NDAI_0D02730 [Naumovozyma dairenensis CBS 421]CCD24587.1 hypothetical protein NDAI_0D02730 [Naumovozyma dairenensis CBS 421]